MKFFRRLSFTQLLLFISFLVQKLNRKKKKKTSIQKKQWTTRRFLRISRVDDVVFTFSNVHLLLTTIMVEKLWNDRIKNRNKCVYYFGSRVWKYKKFDFTIKYGCVMVERAYCYSFKHNHSLSYVMVKGTAWPTTDSRCETESEKLVFLLCCAIGRKNEKKLEEWEGEQWVELCFRAKCKCLTELYMIFWRVLTINIASINFDWQLYCSVDFRRFS